MQEGHKSCCQAWKRGRRVAQNAGRHVSQNLEEGQGSGQECILGSCLPLSVSTSPRQEYACTGGYIGAPGGLCKAAQPSYSRKFQTLSGCLCRHGGTAGLERNEVSCQIYFFPQVLKTRFILLQSDLDAIYSVIMWRDFAYSLGPSHTVNRTKVVQEPFPKSHCSESHRPGQAPLKIIRFPLS